MNKGLLLHIYFLFLSLSLSALERPNILWITSEDNGPDLGAYGLDYAHTPALDNLAKESTIYTNAFATAGGVRSSKVYNYNWYVPTSIRQPTHEESGRITRWNKILFPSFKESGILLHQQFKRRLQSY